MSVEAQIRVIAAELNAAAETIISATTLALQHSDDARKGDPRALCAIKPTLCVILEACAFQDIAGQRLTALMTTLDGRDDEVDPMLLGPGGGGAGLDQDAADLLFGGGLADR